MIHFIKDQKQGKLLKTWYMSLYHHLTSFQAEATEEVLMDWGLDKEEPERFIHHIVSDTTNVNPAFVKQMGYHWIPCAAHLLHLVVQDALAIVNPILQRHRNIV